MLPPQLQQGAKRQRVGVDEAAGTSDEEVALGTRPASPPSAAASTGAATAAGLQRSADSDEEIWLAQPAAEAAQRRPSSLGQGAFLHGSGAPQHAPGSPASDGAAPAATDVRLLAQGAALSRPADHAAARNGIAAQRPHSPGGARADTPQAHNEPRAGQDAHLQTVQLSSLRMPQLAASFQGAHSHTSAGARARPTTVEAPLADQAAGAEGGARAAPAAGRRADAVCGPADTPAQPQPAPAAAAAPTAGDRADGEGTAGARAVAGKARMAQMEAAATAEPRVGTADHCSASAGAAAVKSCRSHAVSAPAAAAVPSSAPPAATDTWDEDLRLLQRKRLQQAGDASPSARRSVPDLREAAARNGGMPAPAPPEGTVASDRARAPGNAAAGVPVARVTAGCSAGPGALQLLSHEQPRQRDHAASNAPGATVRVSGDRAAGRNQLTCPSGPQRETSAGKELGGEASAAEMTPQTGGRLTDADDGGAASVRHDAGEKTDGRGVDAGEDLVPGRNGPSGKDDSGGKAAATTPCAHEKPQGRAAASLGGPPCDEALPSRASAVPGVVILASCRSRRAVKAEPKAVSAVKRQPGHDRGSSKASKARSPQVAAALCAMCEAEPCMRRQTLCLSCHRSLLGLRSAPPRTERFAASSEGAAPAPGKRRRGGAPSAAPPQGAPAGAARKSKPAARRKAACGGRAAKQAEDSTEHSLRPCTVRAQPVATWLGVVRADKKRRLLALSRRQARGCAAAPRGRGDVTVVPRAEWTRQKEALARGGGRLGRLGRSTTQGWGLFAGGAIAAGELVGEYIGLAVRGTFADRREAGHRRAGREDYQFRLGGDTVIDATQAGGMARYINHSCAPNCAAAQCSVDGRLHLGIFAARAIAEGEELTYDYKFPETTDEAEWVECLCGAAACTGYMNRGEDDLHCTLFSLPQRSGDGCGDVSLAQSNSDAYGGVRPLADSS